jgi:hypothetical protein
MLADETAHRVLAYLELSGGLHKRDLAPLGAPALAVGRDLSVVAQKTHMRAVQPLPRRRLASTVEQARDGFIGHLTRQHCDELDQMSTRAPTMLTSAVLAQPQRELIAAHSANHQADGVILNPHYDLFDEPPDGPLAHRRRRAATVSGALDISAEREQAFAFELGQWGFCACRQPRQLVLERARTASKRAFQRCFSSAATRRALALVLPGMDDIFSFVIYF